MAARVTKIPGFDGVLPSGTDPALVKKIEAIAEALDIRLGRRGDELDRAVTLREMIDAGLATKLTSTPFNPNNPRPGFAPPVQLSDLTVPPRPTGVVATAGYALAFIEWDFPLYNGHSQTEVWRFDADTIGDAILIGTSGGRTFVDPVGESADYYYWVRHVSQSNIPGPFHDTNGEHVTTTTNVASLLSVLTGAITSSQLATSLANRVNLIDASAATVGSVAYQIAAEASARTTAINSAASILQSQINDLALTPAYDNGTTYAIDDQVTYSGYLYRCIAATTGNLPTNATYWSSLGAYTSLGDAVANAQAAIVELNDVSATTTSANASALYALTATVEDATTGLAATRATLLTDYYTSVDTDAAIASATASLVSTSALTTALGAYTTTASLTTNYYTKTATDSAIAAATASLVSTSALTTALAAYTTTASLTTNYYTKTATDSAIAAAVLNLVSTTALNTALSAYTTTASLTTNYYTRTETDSAISGALTTYVSTTALNTALSAYTTTASLTTNYYTKTQTDSAISGSLTSYVSTTALNTALGNYTTTASITATYYTIASAAALEAQYMIKLNVNGRVSGFGLYSDSVGSAFVILADRFSIVSNYDNNVVAVPFTVTTTTTTLGGVTVPAGVYIDEAFIKNGSIANAKIANAAIDDAKIVNLSANKITTGTLDTSRLNIDGSTLTSVSGVLQIGSISIDNLSANLITTEKIVGAAINAVTMSEITSANTLPTNATYEAIDSLVVNKELGTESFMTMKFQIEAVATGSGNYALYVRIKRDGVVVSRLFTYFLTRSFTQTVQGEALLIGYGAASNTYTLEVQANVSGSGISTVTVSNSTFIITEVKR